MDIAEVTSLDLLEQQLTMLHGMKELLSTPDRWVKGTYSVDRKWLSCAPTDASAVAWCLEGAARKVIVDNALALRVPDMNQYNDDPGTKYPDVIAAIDREIRIRELHLQLLRIGQSRPLPITSQD